MSESGVIKSDNVAILPKSRSTYIRSKIRNNVGKTDTDEGIDLIPNYMRMPKYAEQNFFNDYIDLEGYKIVPNGWDNLFPYRFRKLIDSNNILGGILKQKNDLLLAGGTYLYMEELDSSQKPSKIIKEPIIDHQISDWLDSWNFESKYLLEQAIIFVTAENNYTLFVNNKARRSSSLSGMSKIAMLKSLPVEEMRMEYTENLNEEPQHFYQANWMNLSHGNEIIQYPAFNKQDPFSNAGSVHFVKMPNFCSKWYGRPSNIAVADYIELKILIINWSKDNLKNTNFKFHIQSPYNFWETVKTKNNWDENQLLKYEEELLAEIDDFLFSETGENAQKRFHSKYLTSEYGKEFEGWKITALDDKTKENSTAYLDAMKYIDDSIIAASALDPALSNISQQGKLSSGLDKMIAFNIYQLVTSPTQRMLILSAVNEAIKINFWKKNYRPRLGFKLVELDYLKKTNGGNDQKSSE